MSALADRFVSLARGEVSGFIPFVVAGDPDLATTAKILRAFEKERPVALEVGIPFSDPMADGPIIQRAAQRALRQGTTLRAVLEMLRETQLSVPVVVFSYFNPILQFELSRFARAARAARVAGVLAVDLPAEEASEFRSTLRAVKMDLVSLIAPTTSEARMKRILRDATGFLYAISRPGVTGTNQASDESRALVRRLRSVTKLPVAVGFGITTRADAERVCTYADAAVVGSKIVEAIEKGGADSAKAIRAAARCAKEFAGLTSVAAKIRKA